LEPSLFDVIDVHARAPDVSLRVQVGAAAAGLTESTTTRPATSNAVVMMACMDLCTLEMLSQKCNGISPLTQ
jgi:hypothetical protein